MKKYLITFFAVLMIIIQASGQDHPFSKFDFLIGEWSGTGRGFGNEKSRIMSGFHYAIDSNYIEVRNESWFDPTKDNPEGEHHLDRGFISYDRGRGKFVYRQFNIEGYVNQYILDDSLSDGTTLVFVTENIENFVPGGKARWTINMKNENEIETIFDVGFPDKEYACFGINLLFRQEQK